MIDGMSFRISSRNVLLEVSSMYGIRNKVKYLP